VTAPRESAAHEDPFSRTRALIGDEAIQRLRATRAAVFGLGGVGSFAFETLVRAGIGTIYAVDADVIMPSNLNRQLFALTDALGRPKAQLARERAHRIDPAVQVIPLQTFVDADNLDAILDQRVDCAIDAIDAVPSKVALLHALHARRIPFVASLGAARRLDPTRVRVADLFATTHCPLARAIRKGLRARGISGGVRCVFSDEPARPLGERDAQLLGSMMPVPATMGVMAAGVLLQALIAPAPQDQG